MSNLAICSACEGAWCDVCDPLYQCADTGFHCRECLEDCGPCCEDEKQQYLADIAEDLRLNGDCE